MFRFMQANDLKTLDTQKKEQTAHQQQQQWQNTYWCNWRFFLFNLFVQYL